MHKDTRWAQQIISLQDKDGKWGYFHTLFTDSKSPITTEKALKRLEILGYTIEDNCIKKAVSYMDDCLTGIKKIPDKREKLHDWDIFTSLLLAAWIRRFTADNDNANEIAKKWAGIVTTAFRNGRYNHQEYMKAYCDVLGMKAEGERLIDFAQFYSVSIINGYLYPKTEEAVIKYLINKPDGIYYTYENCIRNLPQDFESKQASRYLGGIELIAEYGPAGKQLQFVVEWLKSNLNSNGKWDMGGHSKDGLYFPLSNDWRRKETREADCTERISRLLSKIS